MKHGFGTYVITGMLFGVMFSLLGLGYFYLFVESPYLSYRNLPFPPARPVVAPGEVVPLTVERCNSDKRSHNYTVTHSLRNVSTGLHTILPEMVVMIDPGCTTGISRINLIPPSMPAGVYVIVGIAEVHGTLRDHYVEWMSAPFEVRPLAPAALSY